MDELQKGKKAYKFKFDICAELDAIPLQGRRSKKLAEINLMLAQRCDSITMCTGMTRQQISEFSDELVKHFPESD